MLGTPKKTVTQYHRWGAVLSIACLALTGTGCGQEIIESPPIYGIVTGRVMDDGGQGVAGAAVTIALDPVNRMPEAGAPHLVSVDTVTAVDGTFRKTVLVGGIAPFDAVVSLAASPPSGSGLETDSVSGALQMRAEEPYDTLSILIYLPPN